MDDPGIGLSDLLDALHRELNLAIVEAGRHDVQFPVAGVEVEVQVAVTREKGGNAGLRVWVVEFGADVRATAESLQRVTLKLDPPIDRNGDRVVVSRTSNKPPPGMGGSVD